MSRAVLRSARSRLLILAIASAALGPAATPAAAAVNPTSTSVSCAPDSVATGTATSCTVTVADTGTSSQTAPTGAVTLYAAPSTGSFSNSGTCTPAATNASTAACTVSFTATAGGDYTISADFAGDSGHDPSSAIADLTVVDATTTSLSCSPTSPPINTSIECTATLSDTGSTQEPVGQVGFTVDKTTGAFASPGRCPWNPAASGAGGSATCQVSFSATVAGTYTLTATYAGDDTHAASAGTTRVTVTTALTDGGPGAAYPGGGSEGGGSGTLTGEIPAPGSVKIAASTAKVSRKRVAGVRLSCTGPKGASCAGILTLAATTKVKVRTKSKVKVKVKVKVHGKTRTKTVTRTRTRTKTYTELVKFGSVVYTVPAARTRTVSVTLSKPAYSQLIKASHHKLKTTVSASGVSRTVTLAGPAPKARKKTKPKAKKKAKPKAKKKHK